jgi:RHS repeat-associated protein
VVSDKKIGVTSAGNSSLIDHYEPDIVSATDYYPFGMVSRVSLGSGKAYRFGFNGKENDNDVKGYGGQQDYGMRIYDPRVGRFLSTDPLQKQFPDLTPYQFSGNTPIQAIDLDGLEPQGFMENWKRKTEYHTKWNFTVQDVYDYQTKRNWSVMYYPNSNQYFYWETKYENAQKLFKPHNTSLNKQDGQWTGLFKEFVPARLSQDRSFHYAMVGMLSTPFVAMGAIQGGTALWYSIEAQALATIGNAALKYWYHAPAIAKMGKELIELMDESGSVMTGGSSGRKLVSATFEEGQNLLHGAFKYEGDEVLDFLSNKVVNGKTLELTDAILYPRGAAGNEKAGEFGKDAIKSILDKLKEYAKSEGFEKLRITYHRAENSSSSKPGHTVDKTFDLNE